MRKLILILFLVPCALYAQKDSTIYYYDTISSIKCSSHLFSTKCYIAVNNRIGKIDEKTALFIKVGDTVVTIKHLWKKGGPTYESRLKKYMSEDVYWE
jgi:hypothetical protein